ncbi:MAG: putative sulfate exporter family transporter [Chloroflexi bacterium]|nr:putative sulfate exporter family transporter [Chloroflexota bacterium]
MSPRLIHAIGLAACVGIAFAARWLAGTLGVAIDTALALGIGLAVGLVPAVRPSLLPGAGVAARIALRLGVALLGARLTLGEVLTGGADALVAAAIIVVLGLVVGALATRRLRLERQLGGLVTAGMAICGNSAIMALAPIIGARDRNTTYAVSTITIFGLLGVLLLPVIGHLIGLSDAQFGMWAGLGVNDTAQVVATGYAFSVPAGDAATIVKLTRNLAIAPVVIGAAFMARGARGGAVADDGALTRFALVRAVPWFVVGFVALAAARSLGLLDFSLPGGESLAAAMSTAAAICILVALAGVGLSADLRATLRVGPRPFLLGFGLWLMIVLVALGLALTLADG